MSNKTNHLKSLRHDKAEHPERKKVIADEKENARIAKPQKGLMNSETKMSHVIGVLK